MIQTCSIFIFSLFLVVIPGWIDEISLQPDTHDNTNVIIHDKLNFRGSFLQNVIQKSLLERAYAHWEKVSRALNRPGTIAGDPADEIIGNFALLTDSSEITYGLLYVPAPDAI